MDSDKQKDDGEKTTYKIKSSSLVVNYESISDLMRTYYLGVSHLPISDEVTVSAKLTRRRSDYSVSFYFTNNDVVKKNISLNIHGYLFHNRSLTEKIPLFTITDYDFYVNEKRTFIKISPWFSSLREVASSSRSGKLVITFEEICTDETKLKLDDTVRTNEMQAFSWMYQDERFKDVTFEIGNDNVKAHKCVVAARSKVLRAMLEQNLQDKKNKGTVVIKGADVKTFKAFLKYLYTGKIDNIEDVASDLMCLADKYAVKSLKEECERYICSTLDEHNAIQTLIVAHFHNFEYLEKIALMNVKHYINKIRDSNELERLDPYPTLLRKIIEVTVGVEGNARRGNSERSTYSDNDSNSCSGSYHSENSYY